MHLNNIHTGVLAQALKEMYSVKINDQSGLKFQQSYLWKIHPSGSSKMLY